MFVYDTDDSTGNYFYDGATVTALLKIVRYTIDTRYGLIIRQYARLIKESENIDTFYSYQHKDPNYLYKRYLHGLYIESKYHLASRLSFNLYPTFFNRRMMFPKSGYLGRIGKKKMGRKKRN